MKTVVMICGLICLFIGVASHDGWDVGLGFVFVLASLGMEEK
jgi:hypothetical protein